MSVQNRLSHLKRSTQDGERSRQIVNHNEVRGDIVVLRFASLDHPLEFFELFSRPACGCLKQGSSDPVAWLYADLGPRIHF